MSLTPEEIRRRVAAALDQVEAEDEGVGWLASGPILTPEELEAGQRAQDAREVAELEDGTEAG